MENNEPRMHTEFYCKEITTFPHSQVWNISLFLLKEICLGRVSVGVFPRLLSALY
jgi:hypothetical protein